MAEVRVEQSGAAHTKSAHQAADRSIGHATAGHRIAGAYTSKLNTRNRISCRAIPESESVSEALSTVRAPAGTVIRSVSTGHRIWGA
eukprot:2375582-Rhodomonas_salina.2